jgi:hypothetical protein
MIKNRLMRKTFGPKRDKVTGECKRLHSEEFMTLLLTTYFSGHRKKNNEIGGAHST